MFRVAADLADVAERSHMDDGDLWSVAGSTEIVAKPFELFGTETRFLDDAALFLAGVRAVQNREVPTLVIEAVVGLLPVERLHDHPLAVAGVARPNFFAHAPA